MRNLDSHTLRVRELVDSRLLEELAEGKVAVPEKVAEPRGRFFGWGAVMRAVKQEVAA